MNKTLIIKNEHNEEKEYDILFSFESKDTNKKYVVYTDYTKDNDTINCWSNIYEEGRLLPIKTEEELSLINDMLNTLSNSTRQKYNNN